MRASSVMRARLLACALAGGLFLASCGARGAVLGPSSSPCFRSMPLAASTVLNTGHLVGVRLIDVGHLRHPLTSSTALPSKVCVVAFQGNFTAAAIGATEGRDHGPFAVVVVSTDGTRLLATVIVSRLPLDFRHTVIGT
jgi:hypothetical protein